MVVVYDAGETGAGALTVGTSACAGNRPRDRRTLHSDADHHNTDLTQILTQISSI